MNQETKADPGLHVPAWQDRLGGLVETRPRLWLGLGDWESRLLRERLEAVRIERPLYVTGLARSGSTILLELLARHPAVATHRYRDFPVLAAPWAWNWFVDRAGGKDGGPARERAHQDGIAVTAESPEAFEEPLWSAFFPQAHDPQQTSVLRAGDENPDFEAFYRDHLRKLLLLRGGERYLAKGNYNITRLGYLLRLFPDARFVVPIRAPLWHIASLMKQHRLFCAEEERNPRVLRHMRRSGHFEFGLDRRPINTGDPRVAEVSALWDAGHEVEGWAHYWSLIYDHLAERLEEEPDLRAATLVLRYEDLCADPAGTMGRILEHCGLSPEDLPAQAAERIQHPSYYRPDFTPGEAATIERLTADTAARFGSRDTESRIG
ncbi:sulfotransferase family protein [Aquibaculum arenosum]|uniref:Sulfotransferase n=1 Tax=Aquibaculum arenosum TaxID=3032591 RepID=A0ABT5YM90_9PROT|nr:sulfotransferase [Fodinicurvata sp. CAU 1616]MDF2096038.1 sulfotransferase [Fodinicurvata sp. CAU 1616]